MLTTAKHRSRGLSLVEILIALGVLVVLISFATPALTTATAKTDLRVAAENLEFSVRMARNTARQLETDVVMNLNTDPLKERHSVTFTFPASKAKPSSQLQDFQFSPEIRMVSDKLFVRFDSKGMLDIPATVVLVSSRNDDFSQTLVIE
jgi:prepilin-type N-terminal cleavage/methylation domain-containing protein